jgi:HAD superfamily hydrolase (TIGR01509 family)
MGMSTPEWAVYLSADLGVQMPPDVVAAEVVQQMAERYEHELPLIRGALEAVQRLAARWPLGLASSSPQTLIAVALRRGRLASLFSATVSSDAVPHGKPAPDVYIEAARRLGVHAAACVAVEDSSNGLRAAAAAGMGVIAIPNAHYPPDAAALAMADLVLNSLEELTVETVERV